MTQDISLTAGQFAHSRPPIRPVLVALAAILVFWLCEYLATRLWFGPGGDLNLWGVQGALAQTAVKTLALLLGALVIRRVDLLAHVVAVVFGFGCLINLLFWAWVGWTGGPTTEEGWLLLSRLVLLPYVAILLVALRGRVRRWFLAGAALAAFHAAGFAIMDRWFYLESLYYVEDSGSYDDYQQVDVEALYGAQDGLMQDQLNALAPEVPGTPEVFVLLVGGTAYQSVFLNEVEAVGPILDLQYGSAAHTLRLVNSSESPMLYPMANRTNLEHALSELGTRAGPEDMVFLFMTSHGGEDVFALSFYEAGIKDLTSVDLAAMLTRTGIGPAVIVLSACHSGSFLDEIAAPDRLVITAARADRTSFGCADGLDWTEFGRSLFDLALRQEPDPRKAFDIAARDVWKKELWSLRRASLPQISEGAAFGAAMDAVLAARTGP